jgi:hypothetical protein
VLDDGLHNLREALAHGATEDHRLPVTCENVDQVHIDRNKSSSGTTIVAYHGTFRDRPVIVKLPRTKTPSGAVITDEAAADRFLQEAALFLHFRHPHHVKYLGGCFERGKVMNVMEKLRGWAGDVRRSDIGWFPRLCAAKRLARLTRFWSRTGHGAYVHCDFFTHQFAFDRSFNPFMIDVDGLMPSPVHAGSRCSDSSDCRPSGCFKENLWPGRFGRPRDDLDEIQCVDGTCRGFNDRYNIYLFGRVILRDLLDVDGTSRVDWKHTPAGLRADMRALVSGTTDVHIATRWTADTAVNFLVEAVEKYGGGESCPVF